MSAVGILARLREACGATVSLIWSERPPQIEAATGASPAERVTGIVSAGYDYRWSDSDGHLVLYPDDRMWELTIEVPTLSGPRIEVADQLLAHLRAEIAALGDLGGVLQKGDPASPAYADHVTVGGRAAVVEHLAALLGDDPDLAFAVERSADARVLHFERLGDSG